MSDDDTKRLMLGMTEDYEQTAKAAKQRIAEGRAFSGDEGVATPRGPIVPETPARDAAWLRVLE